MSLMLQPDMTRRTKEGKYVYGKHDRPRQYTVIISLRLMSGELAGETMLRYHPRLRLEEPTLVTAHKRIQGFAKHDRPAGITVHGLVRKRGKYARLIDHPYQRLRGLVTRHDLVDNVDKRKWKDKGALSTIYNIEGTAVKVQSIV